MAQWIKDPALSLQRLDSLLCLGFNPWHENFYMPQGWQKRKIEKELIDNTVSIQVHGKMIQLNIFFLFFFFFFVPLFLGQGQGLNLYCHRDNAGSLNCCATVGTPLFKKFVYIYFFR